MPIIEVSSDTYKALRELAVPLVDSDEDVIRRLISVYQEARRIQTSVAGTIESIQANSNAPRAKPGTFTRHMEFAAPLLEVLAKHKEGLPAEAAIDEVGSLVEHGLTELDRHHLKSGEIRWRNNVRWARDRLAKQGLIDRNADFGIWRLKQ